MGQALDEIQVRHETIAMSFPQMQWHHVITDDGVEGWFMWGGEVRRGFWLINIGRPRPEAELCVRLEHGRKAGNALLAGVGHLVPDAKREAELLLRDYGLKP